MRIAIVTDEFVGVNKGGGIAVCSRGLAEHLTREGHDIQIIMTAGSHSSTPIADDLIQQNFQITFIHDIAYKLDYRISDLLTESYAVYQFLMKESYDIVHFNDWKGSGFYYTMARRQGLATSTTVTHLHGPHRWVRQYNQYMPTVDQVETESMEFSQVEKSDYVVSPSKYLIRWYRDCGLKFHNARHINWMLPSRTLNPSSNSNISSRSVASGEINELLFFGRQERRKGFEIFIKAISQTPELHSLKITFLGRPDKIDGEFTGSYALRTLTDHYGQIEFISGLDQIGAYRLLQSRTRALCIMPSLIENSPCVVGECLSLGIPFISTQVGGTGELIDTSSADHCLSAPDPKDLGQKILATVKKGMPPIKASYNRSEVAQAWNKLHAEIESQRLTLKSVTAERETRSEPLVSVCLVHHNRTQMLDRALDALEKQTYENYEIVLVDDGSTEQQLSLVKQLVDKYAHLNIKLVSTQNKYLGAARNTAASNSRGEYLIFHDDDNIAMPHQIETFVKGMQTGQYDVLTAQYLVFDDQQGPEAAQLKYFFMGIGGAFSYYKNRFGDANCIIKRSTFAEIGGFSELTGTGWEDYELFLRLFSRGYKMGVVPVPLYKYRMTLGGMLGSTSVPGNYLRIINSAEEADAQTIKDLLGIGLRHQVNDQTIERTWQRLESIPAAALHRELMSLDPASSEAKKKFVSLMLAIGRNDDAVRYAFNMSSEDPYFADLLSKLNATASGNMKIKRKTRSIEGDNIRAMFITGWSGTGSKTSPPPTRVIAEGRIFQVVLWEWLYRSDVNDHLGVDSTEKHGFRLVAATEPRQVLRRVKNFSGSVMLERKFKSRRRIVSAKHNSFAKAEVDFVFPRPTQASGSRIHIDHLEYGYFHTCDLPYASDDVIPRSAALDIPEYQRKVEISDGRQPADIHYAENAKDFVIAELQTSEQNISAGPSLKAVIFTNRQLDRYTITIYVKTQLDETRPQTRAA